jgi:hypothetical protein
MHTDAIIVANIHLTAVGLLLTVPEAADNREQ